MRREADAGRTVIIGAGMGGLAAAIDLAARGVPVTVCERAHAPGGKMRSLDVDGAAVDAGPTVLTYRKGFEALFEAAGERRHPTASSSATSRSRSSKAMWACIVFG